MVNLKKTFLFERVQESAGPDPGLWDHDLNRRLLLNPLRHPGTPMVNFQMPV